MKKDFFVINEKRETITIHRKTVGRNKNFICEYCGERIGKLTFEEAIALTGLDLETLCERLDALRRNKKDE